MTFEMACYVSLRYGASGKDIEEDFFVDDVAWRVTRVGMMDYWRLTADEVDRLKGTPVLMDMMAFMAAKAKAAK